MTTERKWKCAKTPPLRPEQVRAVVRHRDGYRCVECGMTARQHIRKYGKTLDVHRITPGSPYTIKGCVTICRKCHGPKPRSEIGAKRTHNSGPVKITFHLPSDLWSAFCAYCDNQEPAVSYTAAGITAIKEFLTKRGVWPVQHQKEEGE